MAWAITTPTSKNPGVRTKHLERDQPGYIHQRHLADAVREGIIERGGLPFLSSGVNLCDCVGGGDYVPPSRTCWSTRSSSMPRPITLDAMVLIGTCDKAVPATPMVAAGQHPHRDRHRRRHENPRHGRKYVDFIDIGASISKVKEGK
ncbi:MAG: dihydroxy-acid dehydratase [Dysosmobacter sp.]